MGVCCSQVCFLAFKEVLVRSGEGTAFPYRSTACLGRRKEKGREGRKEKKKEKERRGRKEKTRASPQRSVLSQAKIKY